MSLKNLIRCIRQVHSTGNGYPQMRACLFNFTLCDFTIPPNKLSYDGTKEKRGQK